jgi:long-subunit fatty acid transport protein
VNSWYLNTALLIQRHSNEEVLTNREDPELFVGWDRTYGSGLFGLYASYVESSTLREEIITTGVFTGNADADSTQRDKTFGARWQHQIAPRWNLLTTGEYLKTAFSGGTDLVDSGLVDVRSRLNYEYTERLDTYLQLGYAKLRPDDTFEDTKLARLAVGANYQISEALSVASRAGTYHATGRQSDTDWEAGVQLDYDVGRMRYIAELSRELSYSGVGGFQKADTFSLGWLFDISEIDTLGVNYSFVKFKEDEQILLEESETQEISAFYDRILLGNWRGQANFIFTEQSRTEFRSHGNIVGISLIYDGLSF